MWQEYPLALRFLVVLALICLTPLPLTAQDRVAVERQFQTWLSQTVWPLAQAKGVSRGSFEAAFDRVTLDWGLPDLVPPGSPADSWVNRKDIP